MLTKGLLVLGVCALSAAAQSVETVPFRVNLLPASEVPAVSGDASSATGTLLVHVSRDAAGQITGGFVDFKLLYQFAVTTDATAMHIHRGAAAVNGPVVVDSQVAAVDDTTAGTLAAQSAVAAGTLRDLLANPAGYYVNIHTARNPAGAMRGQLLPADRLVLLTQMSPGNEIPALPESGASAVCAVEVIAARNAAGAALSAEVLFDADYAGLPAGTSFTGFHIHSGAAGGNGPVVINSGLASPVAVTGDGKLRYQVQIDPANRSQALAVAGLFRTPAAYYVNVHTTAFPAGAMRGQLHATDRMTFQTQLAPEAPLDAKGGSAVTLHTLRDGSGAVTAGFSVFDVNFQLPAAAEVSGLRVQGDSLGFDAGLPATAFATGAGNAYRSGLQSNSAALQALIEDPASTLLHVVTKDQPAGALRGALGSEPQTPYISAVISGVSDPENVRVAPLGWVTIFGANLFTVGSDGSGFVARAPLRLNATTVWIGDQQAAVVMMVRDRGLVPTDYIVAQVPADAALGVQPVKVETPGGVSAAGVIAVDAVVPALFFDATGGIAFHASDGTLVRPESPAVPGEEIGLVGTNFGQLATALETGAFGPAEGLAAVVTARFGTVPAAVQSAGMLAGQAGLYAVMVTVPEVHGDVAVTVSQGAGPSVVVSKAVTIPVR